jgi:hypothetical protein
MKSSKRIKQSIGKTSNMREGRSSDELRIC